MIPKLIHYCWFGRNPKHKLEKKCIASWKKFCPDYQIIEWNEDNYDLASAPLFVRQAIEAKKWAFATDYIRLKVVYEYGGIYMDTDVELVKPLDSLLDNKVYFGLQYSGLILSIASGLGFGAEKHTELLRELMARYESEPFLLPNGEKNMTTNSSKDTAVFQKYGLILEDREQFLMDVIHIYPTEYFNPIHWGEKKPNLTEKTISIHWYSASWWDNANIRRILGSGKAYRIAMFILHIPNRIMLTILGREAYESMKKGLRNSINRLRGKQ